MNKERKTLTVSVLKETPDDNWRGWDEETFYLREELLEKLHNCINQNKDEDKNNKI